MVISALELWSGEALRIPEGDNESVPNHGVSSRDEGVQEQGPEVVSVENAHTVVGDSIISFSSVLSPEHHPQAWVCLRLQSGLMPQKRKRGEGRD